MTDENGVRQLVAFLYQRSGRRSMSENELANAASLDLKWYAPKTARDIVAGLVRAGWLERDEEGELEPTFDTREVEVPLSFRPPAGLDRDLPPPGAVGTSDRSAPPPASASTPAPSREPAPASEPVAAEADAEDAPEPIDEENPVGRLLAKLEQQTGEPAGTWAERMSDVVQRTDDALTPEVALLLAAAERGVDVSADIEPARQRLVP